MIKIQDILGADAVKTQDYGVPWVRNALETHNGVDFYVPKFTPVRIPVDGIITRASYHFTDPVHAFGNRVSVYCKVNDKPIELYFCHLDGFNPILMISSLDGGYPRVKAGTIAGWVGSTGSCVGQDGGVHIHIGTREYDTGIWLNPNTYIAI